jgi:metal-responsive CopG/Arc/MetJ family transcriptional regulator
MMNAQKIAITVPPAFLEWLDKWAKKKGRSRSRFIVEEMTKQLKNLEDSDSTQLYDQMHSDHTTAAQDKELAEEMLRISANVEILEEKW